MRKLIELKETITRDWFEKKMDKTITIARVEELKDKLDLGRVTIAYNYHIQSVAQTMQTLDFNDITGVVEDQWCSNRIDINRGAVYMLYKRIAGKTVMNSKLAESVIIGILNHELRHVYQGMIGNYVGMTLEEIDNINADNTDSYGSLPWERDANDYAIAQSSGAAKMVCMYMAYEQNSANTVTKKINPEDRANLDSMKRHVQCAYRLRKSIVLNHMTLIDNAQAIQPEKENTMNKIAMKALEMTGTVRETLNERINVTNVKRTIKESVMVAGCTSLYKGLSEKEDGDAQDRCFAEFREIAAKWLSKKGMFYGNYHNGDELNTWTDMISDLCFPSFFNNDDIGKYQDTMMVALGLDVLLDTGIEIEIVYNPILMVMNRASVAFVANRGDMTFVVVDDLFMAMDIDLKLATLYHEVGHIVLGHVELLKARKENGESAKTHFLFKGCDEMELEADTYSANIIGKHTMGRLLSTMYGRYGKVAKMATAKEFRARLDNIKGIK